MCFNGAWGSVCSSGFGEQEAQVTCRSLGFNIETMSEFTRSFVICTQLMLVT